MNEDIKSLSEIIEEAKLIKCDLSKKKKLIKCGYEYKEFECVYKYCTNKRGCINNLNLWI